MNIFKKILSLVLMFSMILITFACSSSNVKKVTVATGGTSGTYYGFSGVVANKLNEVLKDTMKLNVVSTGGSKANIEMIDIGDADIAIVQNDVMSYAYNATDMFAGKDPVKSFSVIASVYPETIQIIANKSINSIEDLKGKRVSVGDAGSGTEFNTIQILAAYGMNTETDIIKNYQSFADSCDALKNGTLDAAFITSGHPTTAVTELAANYDFNILEVDDAHADKLINDYGFYAKVTITPDDYSVLKSPVQSVAVMATYIANNNLDENVVYAFTKGLFENKDSFVHQKAEGLSPENGIKGVAIPFHNGALKYYKELGLK